MKRLGLSLFLCASSCLVPSLDEVEKTTPHACDSTHACGSGYVCVSGTCHKTGMGECTQGQTQPCGSAIGECKQGTQTCEANNAWGACTGGVTTTAEVCDGKDNDCNMAVDDDVTGAACDLNKGVCVGAKQHCVNAAFETTCTKNSYGDEYETTETKCDGKDNDCDGMVDEGLLQMCPKQQGVCAGSQIACAGGAFPACDAVYATKVGYQTFEQSCDGLDNDCDGKVDAWDLQNLSGTPAVVSKRPSATVLPNGSVLVLWEEGNKVVSRVMNADGTLNAIVTPSDSITAATKAYAPVVASDGSAIYAAWAENLGTTLRVMLAPLDTSGKSTIMAGSPPGPSANPISPLSGNVVTSLSLAVDKGAGRVFVGVVVDGILSVFAYPLVLPNSPINNRQDALGAPAGKAVVAVAGDGGFYFGAERSGLGDVVRCVVSPTGTLGCSSTTPSCTEPQIASSNATQATFACVNGNTLYTQACSQLGKDGGSCGAQTAALGPVASLENVRLEYDAQRMKWLATWVENVSLRAAALMPWDGGSTLISSSAFGSRPQLLVLPNGVSVVVSELDATSPTFASEIVLQRLCAP